MDFNSTRGPPALTRVGKTSRHDAIDAFFAQYYRSHPVNATFTGVHEHDARLPDWSVAARAHEADELKALLTTFPTAERVRGNAYRELSADTGALDAVLAQANIRLRLLEHSSTHFHSRNPALFTGEAIFGVVSLMIRDFAPARERIAGMTARLGAVSEFLQAMRESMSLPVPEGWRDRAVRECDTAVELFGEGLEMWISEQFQSGGKPDDSNTSNGNEHKVGWAAGAAGANTTVAGDARGASHRNATTGAAIDFAKLRFAAQRARAAFTVTGAWLTQCVTADTAAYSIGEQQFNEILRNGHFCEEGSGVMLQRAENALQRERDRLGAMLELRQRDAANHADPNATSGFDSDANGTATDSDPDGTNRFDSDPMKHWANAQAELAADRTTTRTYYDSFSRRWQQIHDAVVAHNAVSWPDWPIHYVPIPSWAKRAAPHLYWLFYRSPAPFDRYGTYEYVVTPINDTLSADEQTKRLSLWNHSTITLNHVVHHGGLGHHLQNWSAVHRSSSRVGTVAAVDCASRIGMFLGGSMAEGWACYATELVEELGLLTPLEALAQQHARVRQLARAVVDIKLHTCQWTFAECVRFYVQQTGMTLEAANAETIKNSMFPGTAIMYWLGTQGVIDLRSAMQERLGAKFNLRAFHDELLGRGSIPVLLAAKLMLS